MDAKKISVEWFNKGVIAESERDKIKCYKEAIKQDVKNYKAWNNLGIVYMKQKRENLALNCFIKALEVNPGYKNAEQNLRSLKRKKSWFYKAGLSIKRRILSINIVFLVLLAMVIYYTTIAGLSTLKVDKPFKLGVFLLFSFFFIIGINAFFDKKLAWNYSKQD